jgi:hypothetical protein
MGWTRPATDLFAIPGLASANRFDANTTQWTTQMKLNAMGHSRELPIPPAAERDTNAMELARVWAAGGRQHVTLATGLWNDPASWGIMLVDLARHIAAAYQRTQELDLNETLNRVKGGFDAEWKSATEKPDGDLID